MSSSSTRDDAPPRLAMLVAILFMAYLCIGMALPVVPVFVTEGLGRDKVWAGLGVGIAFFSTLLTRGWAGGLADRLGTRPAVQRGLGLYVAGALVSWAAAWALPSPWLAYAVLAGGRLLTGLGESLVAVGVIGWGIGLVGPANSGRVLAWIGAAIYGAMAIGGPLGLVLFDRVGFGGTMLAGALLPAFGLLAVWRLPGLPAQAGAPRTSFLGVIGQVGWHGAIVCLQGIGFAAIGAFFALHFRGQHWAHAGLGLSFFGAGFVLVRLLFGRLPDRIGGLPVAIASLAVEVVGQLLIWTAATPAQALLGAFLTGLGCSMIFPSMGREVVLRVPPPLRGAAMGAFSAFQDLAYGLTGPVAGLLADRSGYDSVFLAGAVAAGAGLVVAIALSRRSPGRHGVVRTLDLHAARLPPEGPAP